MYVYNLSGEKDMLLNLDAFGFTASLSSFLDFIAWFVWQLCSLPYVDWGGPDLGFLPPKSLGH